MEVGFDNKINLLKAFAIILVVSGHLKFLIFPFFPTYSFHMALFFFIAGYLFKEEYLSNIPLYIKKKAKRLLIPYFWYNIIYLLISILIAKITNDFYYSKICIKNYLIKPFIYNNQLAFLFPLWFIIQLFISLVFFILSYYVLKKIWDNKTFHLIFFLSLAIIATFFSFHGNNYFVLNVIRTFFSTFFIYLGFYYCKYIENNVNIFNKKCIAGVIILQSILLLFNKTYVAGFGMMTGIDYALAKAIFNTPIVPILTSINGIWMSLFLLNIFYDYIKNIKFFELLGQNTYHIMANNFFITYLITTVFLWLNNLPESTRGSDSFFVYEPSKTTFLYFILTLVLATYLGVAITYLSKKLKSFKSFKTYTSQSSQQV